MGVLTLVMGLPGSGKTTVANKQSGMIIHMDEVRKVLTGKYTRTDSDDLVYFVTQKSVEYYLKKGKDVVLDGALLSKKARSFYIQIAKQYKSKIVLYWCDEPMHTLQQRIQRRNQHVEADRQISSSYLQRMSIVFEMPTSDEGIDEIVKVSESQLFSF